MSKKTKLEQRVEAVAWLAKIALGLVIATGLTVMLVMISRTELAREVDRTLLGISPPAEPVADALAIASLKDYAGLEAERMAKMASALMGVGGLYSAECDASYWPHKDDKVEITYTITWQRGDAVNPNTVVWIGPSWGACIQSMLAWKQGGE